MTTPGFIRGAFSDVSQVGECAPTGTHSVPAVEKVFSVLEVLARSNTGLTLRELVTNSGLPKSSVHGLVMTLQRCGYLYRNQRTSRYLFARKLLMLANNALSNLELRDQADPYLRALSRQTHLPIHLGIVECDEAVVVAKVACSVNSSAIASWVGKRFELHCTGLGKALIAAWTEPELERLVRVRPFSRHNDNTISSLKKLKENLAKVRRLGFAFDDEEDVLGFRCIGVPICDAGGKVIAAISASGTISEITDEAVDAIASEMRLAGVELAKALSACYLSN
jgi:DNA-binding IclR family transcriptional regulator